MICQQAICGFYLTYNVTLTENNYPFLVIVKSHQVIFMVSSTGSKKVCTQEMALQKDNPNTQCFAAKLLKGNRKGWVAHNRRESSILIVFLLPCRPFLTVLFYPYRALLILWR